MATTKATLLGHRSATSFSDLTLSGDLTVNGTTTTLDTAVQNVDKLEIGASSTDYGAKINQASTGNILQLQDGGTDVMVVADGGSTTFSLEDGVTNAVTTVATLRHTSSGTTANGFGTGLRFEGEQPNGGTNIPMASINTVWSNGSAEESDLRFQTGDGGVLSDVMTLTKDGNVGIGTDSPTGTLHIQQSSTGISGSNSDVLTLEKDAETVSINMISDTDRKSNILFSDTTRAQGRIQFDQSSRELSLWTSDASPQLLIDSSGHIGVNATPTANSQFIIEGSASSMSTGTLQVKTPGTTSACDIVMFVDGSGDDCGGLVVNMSNNTTALVGSSDYRIKENINSINDGLTKVESLKPYYFNYKADPEKTVLGGFLAHEVSDLVPEAVFGEKDALDEDGNIKIQKLDPTKLIPIMVGAIQELSTKITALENA